MGLINNLSIKKKLLIPIFGMSVIFIALIIFIIQNSNKFDKILEERVESHETTNDLSLFSDHVLSYINGYNDNASLSKLKIDHEKIHNDLKKIKLSDSLNKFESIWNDISKIDKLLKENKINSKKIYKLLNLSISQSNKYILMTSKKLVNPELKDSVTPLERMVIIGASKNTDSSYKLWILFKNFIANQKGENKISSFLDIAKKQALRDIEKLKNTPFAKLPVNALSSLNTIDKDFKIYLKKVKALSKLERDIPKAIEELIKKINSEDFKSTKNGIDSTLSGFIFITILLGGILFLVTMIILSFSKKINKQITLLKDSFESFANGDLKVSVEEGITNDELNQLIVYFNKVIDNTSELVSDLKENSVKISDLSNEFNKTTIEMNNELKIIEDKTNTSQKSVVMINTQANKMENSIYGSNKSIENIVVQTNDIRNNFSEIENNSSKIEDKVLAISNAVEEMSTTVSEITKSTINAASISQKANQYSNETKVIMSKLEYEAKEIGVVVEIINDIASQTNLLALNATIEAASAGDAGKGFAVVANEIKNLAKQTANATSNITAQVIGIQDYVKNSAESIEKIAKIVSSLNEINGDIATALEQQGGVMDMISSDIHSTASLSKNSTLTISNIFSNVSEVTTEINNISDTFKNILSNSADLSLNVKTIEENSHTQVKSVNSGLDKSENIKGAAFNLLSISEKLDSSISNFKI